MVSYNIYPLWYHDTPVQDYLKGLYDWVQGGVGRRRKAVFDNGDGAGAIYGCRTPSRVKWSEEYQAYAIEKQLEAVFGQEAAAAFISGSSVTATCVTAGSAAGREP